MVEGDEVKFNTEELVSITIGLTILLVLLAMVLAYLYKRFKLKKDVLEAEISGFENKGGYSVDTNKE